MAKKTKAPKAKQAQPKRTAEERFAARQTLAMWALIGNGGTGLGSKLKPRIDAPERNALKKAGLISFPEKGGAKPLEVTDTGWDWANNHLSDPLPDSNSGAVVLQAWLSRLHGFMKLNKVTLADILSTPPRKLESEHEEHGDPEAKPAQHDYAALRERIRKAYLDVTDGIFNARALLRDVRSALPDIDRDHLDATLLRMQSEEAASLMQLDNRVEITDADREAAIHIGREPRHILWISR